MTDKGSHGQEMNKGVQHSLSQAKALELRAAGQRNLSQSEDRLSHEQMVLFARMRDNGAKICVSGDLPAPKDDNAALNSSLSARLFPGHSPPQPSDFLKMPKLGQETVLRSMTGGHIEWIASHPDNAHHFYGLTESGLAQLARRQLAMRLNKSRRTKAPAK